MANLIQELVGNLKTRIMVIIFLSIIGLTSFFVIFGYFNQLATYEEGELNHLMGMVSGLGSQIDGDLHQEIVEKHLWRDDILHYGENEAYDRIAKPLREVQQSNDLESPIFTMVYDEEERIFLYIVTSDSVGIFRHKYEMYPDILLEKMEEGAMIDRYETETGEWLSAFYPIRNSEGKVVGLIQADIEFGAFRAKAFDKYKMQALISFGVIILLALALFPYVRGILKEDEELKIELLEQKALIEERNKDLNESINYASQIQDSMLPAIETVRKHIPNSFVFYKPRESVSGDFYWIQTIGDEVLIAVSDCTGHGIPGALMSMIGLSKLSSIVETEDQLLVNKILDKMDAGVTESLTTKSYRTTSTDGMAVGLCKINKKNKTISFSGAMLDLIQVKGEETIEFKGNRFPIGGGNAYDKTNFDSIDIQMEDNDYFYLYSDGFPNQFGGAKEKKYLNKKFRKFLSSIHHESPDRKMALLNEEFENWKGDIEQIDDVLVVGFSI